MVKKVSAPPTQKYLEIKDIKEDVVILKNKGLRAVLMTTSVNFALKSTEEQEALIYRYQDFLNSLDFSLQILAVSRKFNINSYIETLHQKQIEQANELLKVQTVEYINFVKELTEMANIMTDSFYIVIPYSPPISDTGIIKDIIKLGKAHNEQKESAFQVMKNSLWQRIEFVVTGFRALDIQAVPLKTEELIELFYKLYNPGAKEEITAALPKSKT